MGSADEYAAFEEKVKRTMYVDNLSPSVTPPVLRSAFDQFGNVKNVQFIPNYFEPKEMPQAALVEMETKKQAEIIIEGLSGTPFMVSGMPRPLRARAAEVSMFSDRPIKPGRRIELRWVDRNDPGFAEAEKMKSLTKLHSAEASFLLKRLREDEANLAKKQKETLTAHYQKYEMIENILSDGTVNRLANKYGMKF
ncbi:hypothetical protein Leryth_001356 [Lithospermum erythrorhizon]|nr:hypothetical protein Leryth_001356 [Lithospermum erythrorhizon]